MTATQQSGRRRVTLGLLFLISATLITLDFQSFGPLGTIQTGFREVIAPFRAGGERIASPITGLWDSSTNYDELLEENEELRAEIDRLRGELVRSGVDRGDYEALLAINGLEVPQGYPLQLAKVRTGEVGNFTEGVIEIDIGQSDGVQKDMAVITAAGLVGRVETVDRSSSTVRLVSSKEFVIGVEVAGDVADLTHHLRDVAGGRRRLATLDQLLEAAGERVERDVVVEHDRRTLGELGHRRVGANREARAGAERGGRLLAVAAVDRDQGDLAAGRGDPRPLLVVERQQAVRVEDQAGVPALVQALEELLDRGRHLGRAASCLE